MTVCPSPPPSSRRLRVDPELPVTIESRNMQDLRDRAMQSNVQNRYVLLIIPQEETLELKSFAEHLARRRGAEGDLIVVTQNDSSVLQKGQDVLNDRRALLFTNGRRLNDRVIAEFIRLHEEGPQRMAIAAFSTPNALKDSVAAWPEEMRNLFSTQWFIWPSLKARSHDLPLITQRICEQLVSLDRTVKATLSDEALEEVKGSRNVQELYTAIKDGFDIMLKAAHKRITPQHLKLSRDPVARQRFFSDQPPSSRRELRSSPPTS